MMNHKKVLYFFYATVIYHLCLATHKLYHALDMEHQRIYFKIIEEDNND